MPNTITLLSVELLLLIFENLHDLDDLICLAKTCRVLGDVYAQFKPRLLWSIIYNSDHHKYDAAICRLHDVMHGTKCDAILQPPGGPLPVPSWMFEDYYNLSFGAKQQANDKGQTDKDLQRILTWWKQTTSIRKFYLTKSNLYQRTLGFIDPESISSEQQQNYAIALYLDQGLGVSGPIYSIPNSDLAGKVVSKTRLYRAVMARFLDAKAAQFAKFCDPSISDRLFENVRKWWSYSPNRTLGESLEVLEAFDLVSNFMLLQVLGDPETILLWGSKLRQEDYLDKAENFIPDPNDTLLCNWMDIMTSLQPYLTPFDILSLTRDGEVDRDTLLYLATLLEPHDAVPPGMSDVERDVMSKMKRDFQVDSRSWESYRRHKWRSAIRGKIFCEDLDTAQIAGSITVGDDECHWWQYLTAEESEERKEYRFPIPHFYLMKVRTLSDDITDQHTQYTLSPQVQHRLRLCHPENIE